MIKRFLEHQLNKRMADKKAIIIVGPRQAGKTTLIRHIADQSEKKILFWNGDEADIRTMLASATSTKLKNLIGSSKLLIIDEAQRIENIGLCIKLIVDNSTGVKVIATGSSAFELANKVNEPLTGRKWEYQLYPLSYAEMAKHHGSIDERRLLEQRLIYGYYPEVVTHPGSEIDLLKQIAGSYLYKDILTWARIHKPDKLERLVQALAFQLGNEVSYHELGQMTGLDNETVEKYIALLEKAFVVFHLSSLSRNLRNELKKSRKIYFYDNGLRNAIINQFNPVGLRSDIGALWENFLVSERMKHTHYNDMYCNRFFWRTLQQQEIDYVEEREGNLFAFEFKWSTKSKPKFPKTFTSSYPKAKMKLITPDNFEEFIQ